MEQVYLLQVWHMHQPVTQQMEWVESADKHAYQPLLKAYSKHPDIKFNFNATGSLLDHLENMDSPTVDLLKDCVKEGRAQPLTSPYYQPLVPLISEEYALAHLRKSNSRCKELFGMLPKVAWVPERVYEPGVETVFQKSGVKAILLDDHLLFKAQPELKQSHLYSPHTIKGSTVSVFNIDKEMRYLVPWTPVKDTFRYLRNVAKLGLRSPVVAYADDCEKMGEWPGSLGSHKWLSEFLLELEKNKWVVPLTVEEYLELTGPGEEAVFSAGSYPEMEKWCFGDIRNWLRHPVVKPMFERMSLATAAEPNDNLLKAQANDPYWYARTMTYHRQVIYSSIIAGNPEASGERVLSNRYQNVFLNELGEVETWDCKEEKLNLTNLGLYEWRAEEKHLAPDIFEMKRRTCVQDHFGSKSLDGLSPKVSFERKGNSITFNIETEMVSYKKQYRLDQRWLRISYDFTKVGRPLEFSPNLCFTLRTDTPATSVLPTHRYLFDYAGSNVDIQIADGDDGPGVCWAAVQDTLSGLQVVSMWRPGLITGLKRRVRSEGITVEPLIALARAMSVVLWVWLGYGGKDEPRRLWSTQVTVGS